MYIAPLAIPEQPKNENISNLVNMIIAAKSKDPKADVSKLEHQIKLTCVPALWFNIGRDCGCGEFS